MSVTTGGFAGAQPEYKRGRGLNQKKGHHLTWTTYYFLLFVLETFVFYLLPTTPNLQIIMSPNVATGFLIFSMNRAIAVWHKLDVL